MAKRNQKIDRRFKTLAESKTVYLVLLMLTVIYLSSDSNIINKPRMIFYTELGIAFLIASSLMLWRYLKYKGYYSRKFRGIVFRLFFSGAFTIGVFILQGIVDIPVNYYLRHQARNSVTTHAACEITNVLTRRRDRIHFRFKGRRYSRYFNLGGLSREEILKNYTVSLSLKASCLGTYYITKMSLVKK